MDRLPQFDSHSREEEQDEIVAKALEIIWNGLQHAPLNVNEVAQQLPVTRRTLDRRFAACLGRSVLEEINLCRISRAKQLLSETDMLVKTISFVAGFPSRERMRLLFLKEEGLSPSDYREQTRVATGAEHAAHALSGEDAQRFSLRRVS
ncbi:Xylose operon regulatory protein [Pirellulimonas nuda]|uniref:Xylose operon regulatory protein n=1 Tax=Pirellulimonas nuda TaxID=2528009 RepID=A0A518DG31_9BACT|nr:helix-turn-helix transcriptional regulator [Pirellulimonas nuda]QDU90428.1 Xylose operon regulatory protein [Pirellulimonas nuda]